MDTWMGVLVFGAVIVIAEIFVMIRRDKGWGQSNKQMVGLTIVIVSGLFLIAGGYAKDPQAAAPMFGLLGAIAGYLFGAGGDNKNA